MGKGRHGDDWNSQYKDDRIAHKKMAGEQLQKLCKLKFTGFSQLCNGRIYVC